MLKALPGIANATVVCFLFFVIFAIVGLQQWRGALGYCTMAPTAPGRTTPLNRTECTGTFTAVGVQCVELLPTEALTAACLRNGAMGARLNATYVLRDIKGWNERIAQLTLCEVMTLHFGSLTCV